ncbi:ABC transporter ATP-binding protein [Rubripirellula amarantea]|uniref:Putative ABC transporter ATP-binding protein YbhF n=1 Tax=Rubripirellula amarantea TaxID=2527999 RepID=A0A5C5WV72_9BACT|nr:ABC transporter ATP-binding protein [Rubripirellula amarantea]MDA8744146.1 ABC transporter ATP-binding protein [Rubripirellula amarantea]TWT54460.1 putative ABC transporter ATP-binding protein YbhF [Rubripirellula amarantea]
MKMDDIGKPARNETDLPANESTKSGHANGSATSLLPLEPLSRSVHVTSDDCIELRRLHRFFGDTKAVQDITFTVRRGHVFGYIGPNGAGKTTSMRILATLDLPSYGDAFVDGFSVVNDPEYVRARLGFMPDSFGTYRDVNCKEYLDFFARAYGLVGRERTERLRWVLDFTGTNGMAEKPIRGLSKGMKQRLCLGRALIHDPAVLILDEPAAGLDPRARIQLRQMIRELADRGKTVLISSHILTELAEVCDSVGIIEQGKLLATGSVDEIEQQQANTRELVIRVLDQSETAAAWLKTREDVDALIVDGERLRFAFSGDVRDQASLVASMIGEGFVIAEIVSHKKSLEDVFLQVTEGLVQ